MRHTRHTRVTVTLNCPDLDEEGEANRYIKEWVHKENFSMVETGIRIFWDADEQTETFVPWASVLRIDYDECYCVDCNAKRKARA